MQRNERRLFGRWILTVIAFLAISQAANTYALAYSIQSRFVTGMALVQLSSGMSIFLLRYGSRWLFACYLVTLILTIACIVLHPRAWLLVIFPHLLLSIVWLISQARLTRQKCSEPNEVIIGGGSTEADVNKGTF